jgi:hypothetical protein
LDFSFRPSETRGTALSNQLRLLKLGVLRLARSSRSDLRSTELAYIVLVHLALASGVLYGLAIWPALAEATSGSLLATLPYEAYVAGAVCVAFAWRIATPRLLALDVERYFVGGLPLQSLIRHAILRALLAPIHVAIPAGVLVHTAVVADWPMAVVAARVVGAFASYVSLSVLAGAMDFLAGRRAAGVLVVQGLGGGSILIVSIAVSERTIGGLPVSALALVGACLALCLMLTVMAKWGARQFETS